MMILISIADEILTRLVRMSKSAMCFNSLLAIQYINYIHLWSIID